MQTKRRSKLKVTAVAFAALALVNVVAMVAFTDRRRRPARIVAGGEADHPARGRGGGEHPGRAHAGRVHRPQEELRERGHRGAGAARAAPGGGGRAAADDIASAWKQLGPFNIGGRVTDVVADRFKPNSAFAAVAGGGIWKTTDGGENWTSIWPDENVQPMGVVRAGAGRDAVGRHGRGQPARRRPDLLRRRRLQVDRQRRAPGPTMGLESSSAIGRIAVDPSNSNRVFVAADRAHRPLGRAARPLPHRGRRQDVGAGDRPDDADDRRQRRRHQPGQPEHRLRVDVGPQAHQRHAHLRRHRLRPVPLQGRRRHVGAAGEHRRPAAGLRPDADRPEGRRRASAASASRSRRATRTASTSSPARRTARTRASTTPTTAATRCASAAARTRPTASSGGSGRSGSTRRTRTSIFNADVNLRRSTDGGLTWGNVSGVHADQHAMDWDRSTLDGNPATPRRVFLGNDGGTYRSEANGAPGHVGQVQQPALEPGVPPRGLQAGLAAPADRPAGQRHPTRAGRRPTRRRPIRSCATGTRPAAATATTT